MIRINLLVVCLGMLALIPSISMYAQDVDSTRYPDPCSPCRFAWRTWDEIQFDSTDVAIGECTFKVFFKKRTCAWDGCQEIKIAKIQSNPNPCPEVPFEEVPAYVLGLMAEYNLMGVHPDTVQPGANGCWRFIRPACWRVQNLTDQSCPFTQNGVGDYLDGGDKTRIRLKVGDLAPCDTNSCCTNVMYPTRDICGNVVFYQPEASDYAWHHFLRLPPSELDEDATEEWNQGTEDFDRQFQNDSCQSCTNPESTPVPAPCNRSCDEDVVREYKRMVNRRLKRIMTGN